MRSQSCMRLLRQAVGIVPLGAALLCGGCIMPSADVGGGSGGGTGGGGGSGGTPGGSGGDPNPAPDAGVTLFVIGPNMGFVGFDDARLLSGDNVPVSTELMLSSTAVSQPADAALDRHGSLYLISGANSGSIAIYDNPRSATGVRPPDRIVSGEATQISRSPTGIAIDRENDLLYLSNTVTELLVFDISAPAGFDGAVEPIRTFDVDLPLFRAEQLRFANGSLYVVDVRGGTSDVLAFDSPGSLQGLVTPDRVFTNNAFDHRIGLYVDDADRLFVASREAGQVLIFDGAGTLDGAVTPDVAFTISGADVAPMPAFATTDADDRLYVADASGNVVFSFDSSAGLTSGAHPADRTIGSLELLAPNRLLVFER